jgi:hypothetical protein
MPMLNSIEKYGDNHIDGCFVVLSFDTDHRGIWQCRFSESGMGQFASEPPFESLKESEQKQVKREGMIIFIFTHSFAPNI